VYSLIGENITAIDLIINYHIELGKDVSIEEIDKIMFYVKGINQVFEKLLNPTIIQSGDKSFKVIQDESKRLHTGMRTLFGHYIGNGIQLINMILGYHLDQKEEMNKEDCLKVLGHIATMKDILQKLFKLTAQSETLDEIIRNKLQVPLFLLDRYKNEVPEKDRARFLEGIRSIQEIVSLLNKKNQMHIVDKIG